MRIIPESFPLDMEELVSKNEPDVEIDILGSQLLFSRQLLTVAENDALLFLEERDERNEQYRQIVNSLSERQCLMIDAIQSCANSVNDQQFLPDLFQQYGRSRSEALPFCRMPPDKIQEKLQRRLKYRHRQLDSLNHHHLLTLKRRVIITTRGQNMQKALSDKLHGGVNIYRLRTDSYFLHLTLRNTRELTQGVSHELTFFDILLDAANKFSRIKDYLDCDSLWFNRALNDVEERLRQQQKDLSYLSGVFQESVRGAKRAEDLLNATDSDIKSAQKTKEGILRDIENALEESQNICNDTLSDLVRLNVGIKSMEGSKSGDVILNTFPSFHANTRCITKSDFFDGLHLTYERLKEMTKATNPEQLLESFEKQVKRTEIISLMNTQLKKMIENVLQPESDMFHQEKEAVLAATISRKQAIEQTWKTMQEEHDRKTSMARNLVADQRTNVDGFNAFREVMQSFNARICSYFGTTQKNAHYFEDTGRIDNMLDLMKMNLELISDSQSTREIFSESWDILREKIDNWPFLAHRAVKLGVSNNLVKEGDSLVVDTQHVKAHYITHSQIKNANALVLERARLAEVARLKAADEQAREEEARMKKKERE